MGTVRGDSLGIRADQVPRNVERLQRQDEARKAEAEKQQTRKTQQAQQAKEARKQAAQKKNTGNNIDTLA